MSKTAVRTDGPSTGDLISTGLRVLFGLVLFHVGIAMLFTASADSAWILLVIGSSD